MRRIAGGQGGSGRSSSHVMPAWASAVAGIYGCDIPASALLSYSCFLLDKKAPKNQGRHHRSQRTKRALPRHVGRAHAPNPIGFWHSRSRHKNKNSTATDKAPLFTLMADKDPPSPTLLGHTSCHRFASSRRTKRSIYDRFTIDLFPKKTSISFPVTYPTANDYCRLQTFNQRLTRDKHCIFVA